MKKYFGLLFAITFLFALTGCSSSLSNLSLTEPIPSSRETTEAFPTEAPLESTTPPSTEADSLPVQVSYDIAFNFVKKCEDNIIENNKYDFNKYNESAAEKIIYSDEYAMLYCSYWKALEILFGESDSRFEKSIMRWQIDYSSDEWTNLLIDALKTGEIGNFQDEYARLYTEEVFPAVEYRWKNGID